MTDLSISFPTETPRSRATSVAEWVLASLYTREESPVYVSTLGALTVAFEIYHITQTDEPYIDISLTSLDSPAQPDVVRKALIDVLDAHPSRRAYENGLKTRKLYGWRADAPSDQLIQQVIDQMLDDCADASSRDIRQQLKQERPLPWE